MPPLSDGLSSNPRVNLVRTFKSMRPGAFIDLQMAHDSAIRLKSKLIGFDEGKFLILSLSAKALNDYADVITEGASCIVRTLLEGEDGRCVAFRSDIEIVPIRPKGLVYMSFPKEVESIALRKEQRFTTQFPVTFCHRFDKPEDNDEDLLIDDESEQEKVEISGLVKDISPGGCRVLARWPEHNAKIKPVPVSIRVAIAGEEERFLKAEIKNQHREDPETISIGMKFCQDKNLTCVLQSLGIKSQEQ